MIVRTVLLTVILIGIFVSQGWAGPLPEGGDTETVSSYESAITSAKDKKEEALLRKKLGDYYVSREDYHKAADEFVQAFTLGPSLFTPQERLQMAITISWADRPDDAIRVLNSILAENPEDKDARIHLAKVLSWSNKLHEAETEADIVLKEDPENQEALLVKANALRWRGEASASIPFYEKALAQGDTFDVRVGLAYAYLEAGQKELAQETGKTLKPLYPYQKKEFERFSNSLCSVRARHGDLQYSYYRDSDENTVNRYTLVYGFWIKDWDSALSFRLTDAMDPVRREKAEDLWVRTSTREGRFGVSGGAGIDIIDGESLFIGELNGDANMDGWTIGAGATREVLTDTAQLIQNRIVRTSGSISLSETASPRLSFSESYTGSGYSDGNGSDDLQLGVRYALILPPAKAATGYRFKYLDFRRQSGGGYFDPQYYSSHQVFFSVSLEKDGLYASFDPYVGYQSYRRYGLMNSGVIAGFSGSAGWRLKKCTSLELTAEGGNNAGSTTAGFNYFQVGFRFIKYF